MPRIKKEENQINYIPLIDNYFFSADSDNYTLFYFNRRNKIDIKTKKELDEIIESYDVMGYYTSIEGLIKGCAAYYNRSEIANGNLSTLTEVINQYTNCIDKLRETLE